MKSVTSSTSSASVDFLELKENKLTDEDLSAFITEQVQKLPTLAAPVTQNQQPKIAQGNKPAAFMYVKEKWKTLVSKPWFDEIVTKTALTLPRIGNTLRKLPTELPKLFPDANELCPFCLTPWDEESPCYKFRYKVPGWFSPIRKIGHLPERIYKICVLTSKPLLSQKNTVINAIS